MIIMELVCGKCGIKLEELDDAKKDRLRIACEKGKRDLGTDETLIVSDHHLPENEDVEIPCDEFEAACQSFYSQACKLVEEVLKTTQITAEDPLLWLVGRETWLVSGVP